MKLPDGHAGMGTCRGTIHHGDRIAQAVIAPVLQVRFAVVEELTKTDRGSGGFGSTGIA